MPNQSTGKTFAPLSVAVATTFGVKISVKPIASSSERKPRTEAAAIAAIARRWGMTQRDSGVVEHGRQLCGQPCTTKLERGSLDSLEITVISGDWTSTPPGA